MCSKFKAASRGWRRRGRVRGSHAIFTGQSASDTTTVTTTTTTA
jgi:hypothetical protein